MRTSQIVMVFTFAICFAGVATAQEVEVWPTVAINQTEVMVEPPTESTPDTILICDPCWDVCPDWDTVANAVCRSEEFGNDCQPSLGYQWCAWKSLSSGFKTCKTCIN